MTNAVRDLGPTTERRFAEAFGRAALLTAKAAAALIGVDEKTLGDLTERGVVRAVPRGRLRAYTEHDLRDYLTADHALPVRRDDRPRSAPQRGGKVVPFTERAGRPDAARRQRG